MIPGRTMIARLAFCAVLFLCSAVAPLHAESKSARGKAEHVVLIVWDGMRPDFVTKENAPTLWKLAGEGVTFRNHHSVYPTLTSVNATALATGVFPDRNGGPIGNYEYRPAITGTKMVRMDAVDTITRADDLTHGKYLAVPTIAELVQARGGRTAVAGTKSAPLLFDRKNGRPSPDSVTVYEGATLPESARVEIEKSLGVYPDGKELPSASQDKWTTRALTEVLWKESVPEFSVLWMGDPDRSEHAAAPGSATALGGIKSADNNLAIVLRALEERNVRGKTDLVIVSDHGFSTIERTIDLATLLTKDGFHVVKIDDKAASEGAIRVVGNGGSVFFYIEGHDDETTTRLVEWLQKTDFAGVIFSRGAHAGAFPLSRVHLETATGPDVILSLRWNDRRNADGVAGSIPANGSGDAKGTHGTLSPFDVHNVLIAVGPDFRPGLRSDLPSSNLDVAASIMHLLGLNPAQPLDGRVLTEALREHGGPPAVESKTEEAKAGKWRQYLRTSKMGATNYIDEGNGRAASD